ncbi:hypothetical protein ACFVUN_27455 [Kitasatospora griseola]|uniref:hypothetical protein n=1 Tax=Kitasatospora griseola TaxID=2064 RepID=UPI0036DAC27C
MQRARILLLDAAPGELLGRELERLLGHGLDITLNLRRVDDHARVRAAWGGRVGFTDFDAFDESALIGETVRGGLGHHAIKSRAGVPLRAAFLAAATDPALANRLRVVGRAGAGTDHIDLPAAARHGVAVTHTPGLGYRPLGSRAPADPPAGSSAPSTTERTQAIQSAQAAGSVGLLSSSRPMSPRSVGRSSPARFANCHRKRDMARKASRSFSA